MIESDEHIPALRAGLRKAIRVSRAAEREILAAVGPAERDEPAADGDWSPKDIQAHLSAWRQRETDRLVALREGRDEPALTGTQIDEINAIFHVERSDWSWERVEADARATTDALIAEIDAAAPETIGGDRFAGSIMGNGSEHTLTHLPPIAARVGMGSRLLDFATAIQAILDRGDWPSRPAAFARYNLACFHALGGRLEEARSLLRRALPEQEDLRTYAPLDDDLVALRDEIPSLGASD